jgi:YD repeat-containing protein
MARLAWKTLLCLSVAFILSSYVQAQTATYRLHKEASSSTGLFQLKTAGPDAASQAIQTADLKNTTGEKVIKEFDTQVGDPGASGVIPTGSTVSFTLWMKKSANAGVITPRAKLRLNNSTGTIFCTATGAALGWQGVSPYQFNCTTTASMTVTSTTRLYVWVGVNISTKPLSSVTAELDIEGTQNGNYDSLVVVPQPPPTISSLSPNSGAVGAAVTVTGTNFGMMQGASTLKFNGVTATPTSWSPTAINAPVPSGATTGPAVVTVGVASNGSIFTVLTTGTVAGTITRLSGGTAVSGALVELLQTNVLKASTNTAANGTYSVPNLSPGTYDVRVSANGFITELRTGNAVAAGQTTTVNVALSIPGTLSGKVTKSDGTTAISGASVKVRQGATTSGTTTTNATGDYTVAGLAPTIYTVEASATGYATRSQNGVVTGGSTTTVNIRLDAPVAGTVSYVYDELGRLLSVIGPTETTTYAYDAVGNLQSISRRSSAQVSIINFTPGNGVAGNQVTINGTGFSATASQNAVTFNGVAATVTSSTTTRIVTSVPASATTGPIAVTSPSGSATSSAPFTVGATGMPTITSFTPLIGPAGTAVSITGTNFETVPSRMKVKVNNSYATLTSNTTTNIATSIPTVTASGHVSVATPAGKAVSSQYLFIPPLPYTVADIDYTGQMAIGESKVVSVNTNNKLALVVFEGTAGQAVSIKLDGFPSYSELYILDPNGTALAATLSGDGTTSIYDTVTLPVTGTYTIMMKENGTNGVTLNLNNIVHFTSPITPGGSAVTVTTSTAGQNAKLTFSATAGQRVSLKLSGGTFSRQVNVSVLKSDGTALLAPAPYYSNGGFLDTWTLPAAGTYTILIDPAIFETGSLNANLYDVVDVTGSITPGGPSVPVTINTPGQNAKLTFNGTSGQRVSVKVTNDSTYGQVSLLKPDGTPISMSGSSSGSVTFYDAVTLPDTGTYSLVLDPPGATTGSTTLSLYDATDFSTSITAGGAAVTATTATPGQNARLTFSGTSGQRLSLKLSNGTLQRMVYVSVLKPDGTNLYTPALLYSTGGYIDTWTLPAAGTYTILIDPQFDDTGSMNANLYDVIDTTGPITPGGASVPVTINTPGQTARLTFNGTSGQQATVQITSNTIEHVRVKLVASNGTVLTEVNTTWNPPSFNLATQTLATGTYTIEISSTIGYTGSCNVSVAIQ